MSDRFTVGEETDIDRGLGLFHIFFETVVHDVNSVHTNQVYGTGACDEPVAFNESRLP